MRKVYIIGAKRTAIGSFGGVFNKTSAIQLGSEAMKAAIAQAGVDAAEVQEVLFGNVISANLGQAPARQAALLAGVSEETPCTTINKVCSSGMKSVMFGAQSIALGHNDVVMTGGMENMSMVPYYVPKARFGYKYGDAQLIDGLAKDGLVDVYNECAMGVCADNTAAEFQISRKEQDQFAIQSYERSAQSTEIGLFKNEIAPIQIPQRKGDPLLVQTDEEFGRVKFEKIPALKPAFTREGTVTAANASTINDGAAAILLASEDYIRTHRIEPLAKIVSYADAAHDPMFFTTAPTKATPIALNRAGWTIDQVDLFEVNEAFSVVVLAYAKLLNISLEKINVNGGAVSLGHPLGASGARILTTLIYALKNHNKQKGLAAICNGGGGASAMAVELP